MQTPTQRRDGTERRERRLVPGEPAGSRRAPGWLVAVAIMLAVALVALAAWVVVDRSDDQTLPAERVVSVAEASIAAWDAGDSDAILDLYAEDATFDVGRNLTGVAAIADYVAELDTMGLVVEQRSPVVAVGNTAITVVAFGSADDLTLNLSVLELNDEGLIVSHTGEDVSGVDVNPA